MRDEEGNIVVDCDFETFNDLSIFTAGGARYAQHESCEPLMFSWGTSTKTIKTWVPYDEKPFRAAMKSVLPDVLPKYMFWGEEPPDVLVELAGREDIIWQAHNAEFEHSVWKYVMCRLYDIPYIPPERWRCTAARCAAAGLPRALDKVGSVLNLGIQKDKEGTRLLNIFSKMQPARLRKTKANPNGVPAHRIMPWDRPEEFVKLISYNRDDVGSELLIPPLVPPLPEKEKRAYTFTLEMNDRGLPLDMRAVKKGMPILTELENRVIARSTELAGGIRPTQRDKMLEVFKDLGEDLENLQSKTLKDILTIRGDDLEDNVRELMQLRLEGGKASTKKLKKMLQVACDDGRVRGTLLYYGAHTGRYAGKLIQPQNFTRGDYKPHQQEALFQVLLLQDADTMEFLYRWPIDAVAQGMRGFIKASKGHKFVVSDFAAIEARMLAWLADEEVMLEVYRRNGDVYVRMAAALYKVDEAELLKWAKDDKHPNHKDGVKKRKFGKDIVLGCGFQMGGPGFYNNCIMRGIKVEEDECKRAVKVYREEVPNIVKFWYDIERCAIAAVTSNATAEKPVMLRDKLRFFVQGRWLCIRLPSGRLLRYIDPKVQTVMRFNKQAPQLSFKTEVKGKWVRETTYGGKLVENVTQAVARDVMVEAMFRVSKHGYAVVGTVHDELICEVPLGFGSAKELETLMSVLPKWCPGAPISCEGWEGDRYRK